MAAAQSPKPQTVAIAAEDAEFSRNAAEGARANAKQYGFKVVYDKSYPPNTTDYSPVVRAIRVVGRMDCDRRDAEDGCGAGDANSNFATIGNQDFTK